MENNSIDLGIILRKLNDDLIGQTLDLAKISPMNERQYKQFEISIKKYFRELVDSNLEVIKQFDSCIISDKEIYLKEKQGQ